MKHKSVIQIYVQSFILSLITLLSPVFVFAQSTGSGTAGTAATSVFASCSSGIKDITGIFNFVGNCLFGRGTFMLIIAIALILFMLGAIRYMWAMGSGNEKDRTQLLSFLGWGIVTLFVMLSVWGLVYFIGGTLGIGQGGTAPIPQFPTSSANGNQPTQSVIDQNAAGVDAFYTTDRQVLNKPTGKK